MESRSSTLREALWEEGRLFAGEWRSLAAPFFMDLCLGLYFLGLSLLLKARFQATNADVLWITAFGQVVYVIFTPLFGQLAGLSWRSKFLVMGPLFVLGSMPVVILSGAIWQVYIGVFIYNVGAALFWPSLITTITRTSDVARALRRVTVFNTAWIGGFAVGGLIAGSASEISPIWPFIACGVTAIIVIPVVIHADRHHSAPEEPTGEPAIELVKPGPIRRRWFLWMAWVANFTATGSIVVVRATYPVTGKELGFSNSSIGLLAFLAAISQLGGFLLLGLLPKRWYYRFGPLIASQAILAVGCFMVGYFTNFWIVLIAMLVAGFGVPLAYMMSISYSCIDSDDAATKSGFHESILGGGACVIPLVAAFASHWWASAYPGSFNGIPYCTAGAFLIVMIGVQCVMARMMVAEDRRRSLNG